jgi:HNH endonuclease/AP2 domain
MRELTSARLREVLDYDPATGLFTRRIASGRVKAGDIAGGADRNGHIRIFVDGRLHAAHRLVWLHVFGAWPALDIDHIDGARNNNRLANLRDVSKSANMQNQRRPQCRNTTGFLGVTFNKRRGKFQAQIGTKERRKYIGLFDTAESAHAAYLQVKRQLHEGNML